MRTDQAKKSRLIGLCDVWGWVTTYCAAADAAPSPNRLHPKKPHTHNENRNVNPAIGYNRLEIVDFGYKKPVFPLKIFLKVGFRLRSSNYAETSRQGIQGP